MTELADHDGSLPDLAARYLNITRRLVVLEAVSDAFDALTNLAAQVPGAQDASMTRLHGGHFETLTSTDAAARQADNIQYDLGSGPCVDAILEDTLFRTPDLRTDVRWPEFGRRAFEETGMLSMLSIRLFLEDDSKMLVGINMYSRELAAFDDDAETVGVLLATHGSLAVAGVTARQQVDNLKLALQSRTEIGIAMGILMSQHKLTRDDAFNLLRLSSQHTHRKLHDVATELADTGVLPVPPRRPR